MIKFHEQFDYLLSNILHLSGNGVAKSLGAHQGLVNRYRSGLTAPSVEFTQKFCELYKISANWLLLDIGPMRIEDIENNGESDKYEKTLIQLKAELFSLKNSITEVCEKYEI